MRGEEVLNIYCIDQRYMHDLDLMYYTVILFRKAGSDSLNYMDPILILTSAEQHSVKS